MRGNAALYPQTENGYNSETADNYEAGVKSTLFDDTLLLNFTVFYDPYSNAQIGVQQFVVAGGVPQNVTAVLNAGKQINRGVETRIGVAADQGRRLSRSMSAIWILITRTS